MYLYETHCHSSIMSICSRMSGEALVDFYVKNGYRGIFLTDHFFNNGSCNALRNLPATATYTERVHEFCRSFREVRKIAEGRLDVFFGFEYTYGGTDVLTFGWGEDELAAHPEILTLSMRDYIRFAKENGALTVQAHPFREAHYIDHIRLYPEVEGVEVLNACRDDRTNTLARFYAEQYGKIMTGGTDLHAPRERISGMYFDTPLASEADFVAHLRAGEGTVADLRAVL